MADMETMSGRMGADMRHVFHETGRLWPVADAHGATVLFGSKDAADLYAAEHDATVGAPMPTMKAAALWSAARMTLAADGGSYEITALPDVERRTDAKRPGARVRGALNGSPRKDPGGRARPRRPRGPRRRQDSGKGPRPESGDRPPRVPRTALDGGGPMTRRYYAVLTRTDMPIIPYHVHAFDSAARRDAWCAGPVPRGFDAQPATAHAALRDLRADMRLDDAWGATVDEYLERHPERWHDGAHDATTADAAAALHVWWRWCEVNRWEHETWAVYTPMDDPADAALAVRLGERLRELQSNSGVLDRMFTGFSDRLPNGERADTGWAPPTSTAVMDDGLRERMRRAVGAWTWQEFLGAVYKLGLFRED